MPQDLDAARGDLFGPASYRDREEGIAVDADTDAEDFELSPLLSLDDFLDEVRYAEGEDPVLGIVPIFEYVIDEDLQDSEPDMTPDIGYDSWSTKERARLLSRLPVELLNDLFTFKYGRKWWEQEPEVLLEDLGFDGVILDGVGITKLRALHSILRAPQGFCPFYTEPHAFMFLCVAFSGRAMSADDLLIPTPIEIATALHIMAEIRPYPFDPEVEGMAAACLLHAGLWCLPNILYLFQDEVLRICQGANVPVDAARVERVQYLAASYLLDDSQVPDASEMDEDSAQAVRAIALDKSIDDGLHGVDQQRDALREALRTSKED